VALKKANALIKSLRGQQHHATEAASKEASEAKKLARKVGRRGSQGVEAGYVDAGAPMCWCARENPWVRLAPTGGCFSVCHPCARLPPCAGAGCGGAQ
jgi:hypothetical protein